MADEINPDGNKEKKEKGCPLSNQKPVKRVLWNASKVGISNYRGNLIPEGDE